MSKLDTLLKTRHFTYSGSYGSDMPLMPLKNYQEGLSFIRNGGRVTIRLGKDIITVDMTSEFAAMHLKLAGE